MFNSLLIASLLVVVQLRADVISIGTEKEFNGLLKTDNILVKFYAPWCGHCKAIAPEYIKAAEHLKKNNFEIKLVEVDCTSKDTKAICNTHGIRGYPTIKYFVAGNKEPLEYSGGRNKDGLIGYAKKMLLDSISHIKDQAELDKFVKENKIVVVEYVEKEESKKFLQIAEKNRLKFAFAKITDEKLIKKHNAKMNEFHIFRSFDEPKIVYNEKDGKKLSEWIIHHSLPIMGELDSENYGDYQDKNLPLFWFIVDPADKATFKKLKLLHPVLKENRDKIIALYVDGIRFKEAVKAMGFDKNLPSAMIIHGEHKYKMTKVANPKNLKEFIDKFNANKLEKFFKSEPLPKKNDGPIIQVVGSTFNEIVMDEETDVLVEFYMISCPHCEKFAPEYKKLGEQFKDIKSVKITKMNGQLNDSPIKVEGFPTVALFQAGKKDKHIIYTGDKTAAAISKWISTHSLLMQKEAANNVKKEETKTEKKEL